MGTGLSPALLGVGYIVGLNIGIVVVSGSILACNIAIPFYSAFLLDGDPEARGARWPAQTAAEAAAIDLRRPQIRYLGVGTMLVGGIWTLISLRKSLLSGVRSGIAAAREGAAPIVARNRTRPADEVGADRAGACSCCRWLACTRRSCRTWRVTRADDDHHDRGRLPVRARCPPIMAGLVGSSNNPVSGITIATILFASLVLMLLLGSDATIGAVAAIMIGAVVCCAAAVGGDNLQDLKAGYIVGATPWRQQVMLGIGAFSCALIMAPVLNLLAQAYGIGVPDAEHPNSLHAPQATLMASVAQGLVRRQVAVGHDLDRRARSAR